MLHGKKKESSSHEVKFAECQIEETEANCVYRELEAVCGGGKKTLV